MTNLDLRISLYCRINSLIRIDRLIRKQNKTNEHYTAGNIGNSHAYNHNATTLVVICF